jgi:hypothetical protein
LGNTVEIPNEKIVVFKNGQNQYRADDASYEPSPCFRLGASFNLNGGNVID